MGIFSRERHDKQCFVSVFEVISLIFVQFNLVKFWENGRKTDNTLPSYTVYSA